MYFKTEFSLLKQINENPTIAWFKKPIKLKKLVQCLRYFLAAFVKNKINLFPWQFFWFLFIHTLQSNDNSCSSGSWIRTFFLILTSRPLPLLVFIIFVWHIINREDSASNKMQKNYHAYIKGTKKPQILTSFNFYFFLHYILNFLPYYSTVGKSHSQMERIGHPQCASEEH